MISLTRFASVCEAYAGGSGNELPAFFHLMSKSPDELNAEALAARVRGNQAAAALRGEYVWLARCGIVAAAAIAVLCVVLAYCAIRYGVPAVKAWQASSEQTASGLPEVVRGVSTMIGSTTADLHTVALNVGVQTAKLGAVADALRTNTIPAVTRNLDAVGATTTRTTADIDHLTASTAEFVDAMKLTTTGTNGLIPAATADLVEMRNSIAGLTRLETQFGLTAEEATKAINDTAAGTGRTTDQITAMLASADPRVQAALDKTNAILQDVKDTTASMPTIGKNVEKTTHNIAAFSKVTIITGILSSLANATIPGLLH
jgi:hypothetical protein